MPPLIAWLDRTAQDLRYTVRTLLRSPGFALLALAALTLGIGANIAIFSVVNAVLWRSLPYADSGRLVTILHGGTNPVAAATFLDWRAGAHSFSQMEAAGAWSPTVSGGHQPEVAPGLRVTPGMFRLLGVKPAYGRYFQPSEGAALVTVVSMGFAERHFGSAPEALGRIVHLDGQPHTIVGIMPRDFRFAPFWITNAELWGPLDLSPLQADRNAQIWRVFARLRPGVTATQASAEMDLLARQLARQYPESNAGLDAPVIPLKDKVVTKVRTTLLVLLSTVSCVLLIACVNLALLLLSRASGRRRELAIRAAIGADRTRLLTLMLTESLLLSMLGGAFGLVLAKAAVAGLVAALPAGALPRQAELDLDWSAFALAAALSLVVGLAAGLVPAWRMSRRDVNEALKAGSRGQSSSVGQGRSRRWLLSVQSALTLMLLTIAGLLVQSFVHLQGIDPGFDPSHLLTLQVSLVGTTQATQRPVFYRELTEQLRHLPGVEAAAAVNHVPLAGDEWAFEFQREGDPAALPGQRKSAVYRVVEPGYFAAMRIPVIQGRDFAETDRLASPAVVLINQTMARLHWPSQSAVGQRITMSDHHRFTIAGVIKDVRQSDWAGKPREEMYFPLSQSQEYLQSPKPHYSTMSYVVRTSGDPAQAALAIRHAVFRLDRSVPVSEISTMERTIRDKLWRERLSLQLISGFALVALVLALAGIYAVVSYAVNERKHEMGIRLALGARPSQVIRLAVREGMVPVLTGLIAGIALSALSARGVSALLFGISPLDVRTAGAVFLLLSVCALGAHWIPARRLLRLDPTQALRSD